MTLIKCYGEPQEVLLIVRLIGVTTGHEKILELTGVGFRANLKGNVLNLQIGFSHDVSYKIPEGVLRFWLKKVLLLKYQESIKSLLEKLHLKLKCLNLLNLIKVKVLKIKRSVRS